MSIELPNHTQVPNIIIDEWMRDLKNTEFKMIMAICRKTFGWQKWEDAISISQLKKITGMSNRSIIDAGNSLEEKGLIKTKKEKCKTTIYKIDYEKSSQEGSSEKSSHVNNVHKGCEKSSQEGCEKSSQVGSEKSSQTKDTSLNKIEKTSSKETSSKDVHQDAENKKLKKENESEELNNNISADDITPFEKTKFEELIFQHKDVDNIPSEVLNKTTKEYLKILQDKLDDTYSAPENKFLQDLAKLADKNIHLYDNSSAPKKNNKEVDLSNRYSGTKSTSSKGIRSDEEIEETEIEFNELFGE
ncbi:replication protein [Aliifodinibius sp. S!AR15-10]|uniref:replication protein n=1 Tax=Aliifodinibius sp. S!AR15-10 TaxID=2950437 RepID=UPI002863DE2D|nr:replication protein [Aliifodinibius sp. S!AR15-10]MDR8390971.1 replication protein [Aliifodinibius sp. S!AR15-10]